MIEVFKTDVETRDQACTAIDRIQKTFSGYQVNFDLEDCDRVLRVKNPAGEVDTDSLIDLLKGMGVNAELLPDLVKSASSKALPAILSGFAGRPSR